MKRLMLAVIAAGLCASQVFAGQDNQPKNEGSLKKNAYIFTKNALKTSVLALATAATAGITGLICKAANDFSYEQVADLLIKITPEPVGIFDGIDKVSKIHNRAKFWHNNRAIIGIGAGLIGGSLTLYSLYQTAKAAIDTIFFVDSEEQKKTE